MTELRRIRSFRCADALWRSLEDESDERGMTIDSLITEALWSYLRAAPEFSSEATKQARLDAMAQSSARTAQRRTDTLHEGIGVSTEAGTQVMGDLFQSVTPTHHVVTAGEEEAEQTVNNLQLIVDDSGQLLDPRTGKPLEPGELPEVEQVHRRSDEDRPKLALVFSGTRYEVAGERFLIGRASTGTDLQIRDANVSRKHAAIIFHDGGWFIHDLQSTNGVEFRGRRIHTRRIEHNDRYSICDYELIFDLED